MKSGRKQTHGHYIGDKASPTYRVWQGMISRCRTPKAKDFLHYKGRGITVCERWQNFVNFLEDMGCKPDGYTLDRIDNDGPYCKENCRWACVVRQVHNSRASKLDWGKVAEIRHMHTEGFSQIAIAQRFGIHQTNVHYVVTGKTWSKTERPVIKKSEGYSR